VTGILTRLTHGPLIPAERHERIADIPADAWDRIAAPHGIYLSHAWLASVERSRLSDVRYLTVHFDGRLAGALPLYLMRQEENASYHVYDKYLAGSGSTLDWYPTVLAGTRTAYRNALIIDSTLPPGTQGDVLRALLTAAAGIAGDLGAVSLALSYLDDESLGRLDAVSTHRPLVFFANTDFSIDTTGLTDARYRARLGAHRTNRLAADRRRFDRRGYTVTSHDLAGFADEGGPLVAHLCRSHGTPMTDERGSAYLADIAASLPGRAVAFAARLAGDAVACAVCLVDDRAVYARTYGYREGPPLRDSEYFTLCYELPTAYAIANGLDLVHLGTGTIAPKLLRGATPRPLWTVLMSTTAREASVAPGWARDQRDRAITEWRDRYPSALPLHQPDLAMLR
jgi:predicted N-acyltransferase